MSTNNPMTLPSASSLTDEQLRVLCAEADGFVRARIGLQSRSDPIPRGWTRKGREYNDLPDYLHDANAALRLLKGKVWSSHASGSETSISVDCIQVEDGIVAATVSGSDVPAFCRAIVLAFLRAEGKIL